MSAIIQNGHLDLIVEEFRTVFKNKGLEPPAMSPETILDGSLGLESLDFAEVVMRLEQVFGRDPFGGDTIPEVSTLADFVRCIEKRRNERGCRTGNGTAGNTRISPRYFIRSRRTRTRLSSRIDRSVSWAEWLRSVDHLVQAYAPFRRSRIGLLMRPCEQSLCVSRRPSRCSIARCFCWTDAATAEEIEEIARSHRFDRVIDPDRELEPVATARAGPSRPLAIRPWPTTHDFHLGKQRADPSLFLTGGMLLSRTVRKAHSTVPQCWLLTYRPQLYAGLQVFLHCLLNQETLVIPDPGRAVDELLAFAQEGSGFLGVGHTILLAQALDAGQS